MLWASGEVQPWNYPPEASIESGTNKFEETSEEKTESEKEKEATLQSNTKLKD